MNCNPKTLGKILFKSRYTEFEIQAEIYRLLRDARIDVRGEVTAKQLFGDRIRRCKFDLVVFSKREPFAIIEVKQWGHSSVNGGIKVEHKSWQADKYRTFGIPIIWCGHFENAPLVIAEVLKLRAQLQQAA